MRKTKQPHSKVLSMIYAVGRRLWMQAEMDMLMRDALKASPIQGQHIQAVLQSEVCSH